ncbi:hypothetical protein M0G74_08950 [Microbulbifer sp. CAU 1566]|uniref:hypothetical protein n=1 Tax=Microbulbifer sp. CAU 1566 TaxID=2933269 RepID=UPI002005764E|nr:hypothetical protein [Microbulbifer sp. CAU 1566]MCK7597393.1 hypothetical protein [Microbulbifer sp. CAU 1566]
MGIFRSDVQVALNDLHLALQESADHYRFAAEFLGESPACQVCEQLAGAREALALKVADLIRAAGELPSEPDRDLEAAAQLRQQFEALFSEDAAAGVVRQRIRSEMDLENLLKGDVVSPLEAEHAALLRDCRNSAERALKLMAPLADPET